MSLSITELVMYHQADIWWTGPFGISCLLAIILACAINIFYQGIDDCLLTRIYYWCLLIYSFASVLSVMEGRIPILTNEWLVFLVACRVIIAVIEKVARHKKTGLIQKSRD